MNNEVNGATLTTISSEAEAKKSAEMKETSTPYQYFEMPFYESVKRILDVLLAVVGIVLTLPLMIVVAIAIRLEDNGPILYRSIRIGRYGKPFLMYKFRSMKPNSDSLENVLTKEQLAEYKKDYKLANDPRTTRIGRIIRKTSIDEIPQFFNVLEGKLSIVGPRPVLQEETELYGEFRDLLLSVQPGVTGYWQVNARNNVSYDDFKRQDMELYYVSHRSLSLDIKILFQTIGAVLTKHGVK